MGTLPSPCPRCGSEVRVISVVEDDRPVTWYIRCPRCGASTGEVDDPERLLRQWDLCTGYWSMLKLSLEDGTRTETRE